VAVGRKVAIVGGGNVAVDVARTAVRLGAESVTILYRRTGDQMPAYEDEVAEAVAEGVKFEFLVAPLEVLKKDGQVAGLKCGRMKLGQFDKSGRRRPEQKTGEEFVVEADQVIPAIGQALEAKKILNGVTPELSKGNWLKADPVSGQTSVEWLFAAGDAVTGPASVVEAIAAGERAAVGMDQFLTGESHAFWRTWKDTETAFDPDAAPVKYGRAKIEQLSAAKRKNNFKEVEQSWDAKVAIREARRCLRCDYREKEETSK
jgi:NADH-quinone oxidoreductase subunit F